MNHEEAMTVAARKERAEVKDLVPALGVLFDSVRRLERERDAAVTSRLAVAMPDGRVALAVNEIVQEFLFAGEKFGPFKSPHEGIGVIREEYRETEDWVFLKEEKRDPLEGRREAKQLAAAALRLMTDSCELQGGMIAKPVAAIIGERGSCARAVCALLIGVVLTVSGCAAPAKSYLTVTDPAGKEVLRVQENGKFRWKAKRDEVARVMLGLLIQKEELLKKLQQDLVTCKTPAAPAKAKK